MKPLGYSERLVRTSVFRLVKEDWLQGKKIGRKSFYSFTQTANNHYTKAARRIYSMNQHPNDESWLILIPSFVAEVKMPELKRQLKWLGFSSLSSGVFAHPNYAKNSLHETLKELSLSESVIIFEAKTSDEVSAGVLKKLVFEKWQLQTLQQGYQSFIEIYQSLESKLDSSITDQQSFALRILLIHEFRRILLNDYGLSVAMLPEDWLGHDANQLVQSIYKQLSRPSTRFITSSLKSTDGYLPKARDEFSLRFQY